MYEDSSSDYGGEGYSDIFDPSAFTDGESTVATSDAENVDFQTGADPSANFGSEFLPMQSAQDDFSNLERNDQYFNATTESTVSNYGIVDDSGDFGVKVTGGYALPLMNTPLNRGPGAGTESAVNQRVLPTAGQRPGPSVFDQFMASITRPPAGASSIGRSSTASQNETVNQPTFYGQLGQNVHPGDPANDNTQAMMIIGLVGILALVLIARK